MARVCMDVQPPSWLCMKSKYIHMSMLIQGPKQPGNNINLYLGLLQEELDTLWKTPAKTWDAGAGAEGMEDEVCVLGLGVLAQTRYTSLP